MNLSNIKTIEQLTAMLNKPIAIIKTVSNSKTIGRIYQRHGAFKIKLYARGVDERYNTTYDALIYVQNRIGKSVKAE